MFLMSYVFKTNFHTYFFFSLQSLVWFSGFTFLSLHIFMGIKWESTLRLVSITETMHSELVSHVA